MDSHSQHRYQEHFTRWLQTMSSRVREAGPCFLIMEEACEGPAPRRPRRSRARRRLAGSDIVTDWGIFPLAPAQCPQPRRRFVQFCFEPEWFCIDLPDVTLTPAEADRLLRERLGFFREAEVATAGVSSAADLVTFDPVVRKYIPGDEPEAAADTAWIWFDLWGVPSDSTLLTAKTFEGDANWEQEQNLLYCSYGG